MPELAKMEGGYAKLWDKCVVSKPEAAAMVADRILKNKKLYQGIEIETGVPWVFIGVIHIRESDGDMKTHLHNGDSLRNYTHQVPAGRPKVGHEPPFTWDESAIDALKYEKLDKVVWNGVEVMLFEEELYNGWGYLKRDANTPYVWSWTNLYFRGKYVQDGVYSETAVDQQPGTAALMKALAAKDDDAKRVVEWRYDGGVPAGAVVRHTRKEQKAAGAGAAGAATGATTTAVEKPMSPGGKVAVSFVSVAVGTIGLAVALVAGVLMYRKAQHIKELWLGKPTL